MSLLILNTLALLALLLAGSAHGANAPTFRLEKFFDGHTRSTGVFYNNVGKPQQRFTTDCHGRARGRTLWLDQHFRYDDGHTQDRHWQIRRVDDRHYIGRASDVVGEAHGEAIGPNFRFSYIVALQPKNPLLNVRLEQTMTLQRNGSVENRATIRKLGLPISRITERFHRAE